ncbi:hypothetical protein FQR65_LT03296 [Abscondita terminalis]|nr:hypothetical protein FQR65_LT03296 [Abscondita terminalis]
MAALRYCFAVLLAFYFIEDAYAVKGSSLSQKGQFPYQADLIIEHASTTLYRTGSLITTNYLLTTASNVQGSTKIAVILGVYNVEDKQEPSRRTYDGVSFKVHEKYTSESGPNNIALIKLNQSAEINEFIQVVPIPRFSYICLPLVGKTVRVSGWGDVTAQTPPEYQVLRYADIEAKSYKRCQSTFPLANYKQLCSTCKKKYFEESDIGAPLVLGKTLVGIASATNYVNGSASSPQLYTRLDTHLEWIELNSDLVILGE